jgi:hypothetical protein
MLLVVMLMIAVLTERGAISMGNTLSTYTNSQAYKTVEQALVMAESGANEARTRLWGDGSINPYNVRDPAAPNYNKKWTAFINSQASWSSASDPYYDKDDTNYFPTTSSQVNTTVKANSVQTTIPYWIKIRHKREYDMELEGHTTATPHYVDGDGDLSTHDLANPGNIIYYGFYPSTAETAVPYTTSTTALYKPLELVRVYATNGTTQKMIEFDAARHPGPNIQAALYAKGNITLKSSTKVEGENRCGSSDPDKPPIYVQAPSTSTGGNLSGSPSTAQPGPFNINIKSLIDSLKSGATTLTTDIWDKDYGSSGNYKTIYTNTSSPANANGLKLDFVNGYGILLVEGDLVLGHYVNWNGVVLVTGNVTYSTKYDFWKTTIDGIMVANQSNSNTIVDLYGNTRIRYDACEIEKALLVKPLLIRRWREV